MIERKESDIKRAIKGYLEIKGCLVMPYRSVGIRKPNGSYIPMHGTGISDLLGLTREGKFFAIEVKRPGGRPTPDQMRFLESVRSFGCRAFIATSIKDVQAQGL